MTNYELAKQLGFTFDCGSSSCNFLNPDKPLGQRVNGGCTCFSILPGAKRVFVYQLMHEYRELKKLIGELA